MKAGHGSERPGSAGGIFPPLSQDGRSRTSYSIRRMANYDDPALADVDLWNVPSPRTDDIMLMKCGVEKIESTSSFSLMADEFTRPSVALRSHVPGIEVLCLDGHVKYFLDYTEGGDILYHGNGITNNQANWLHDDIWMIIDGYHKPPVGQ